MPTVDSPDLLTVNDAAGRLSISRATLYDLLRAGQLRSVSIGRARRIPAADLDDFVKRLRQNGPALLPRDDS